MKVTCPSGVHKYKVCLPTIVFYVVCFVYSVFLLSGFCHPAIRWCSRGPCVLPLCLYYVYTFTTSSISSSTPDSSSGIRTTVLLHYGPCSPFCIQTLSRSHPGGGVLFPSLVPLFHGYSVPFRSSFSTFLSLGSLPYSVPGFPNSLSCPS